MRRLVDLTLAAAADTFTLTGTDNVPTTVTTGKFILGATGYISSTGVAVNGANGVLQLGINSAASIGLNPATVLNVSAGAFNTVTFSQTLDQLNISGTGILTAAETGTITLSDASAPLTITSNGFAASNPLTFTGAGTAAVITLSPANAVAITLSGAINLGSVARTFQVAQGSIAAGSADAILSGIVTSTGPINKTGNGTLELSNQSNSINGTVNVVNGTVAVPGVASAAAELGNPVNTTGNTVTLGGTGTTGQLLFLSTYEPLTSTFTRPITLNTGGGGIITNNTTAQLNFADAVTGLGSPTIAGSNVVDFTSASNNYSGGLTVATGAFEFTNIGALGTGTINLGGVGDTAYLRNNSGSAVTVTNSVNFNGGTVNFNDIYDAGGNDRGFIFSNPVTLTATTTLGTSNGYGNTGPITFNAAVTDSGGSFGLNLVSFQNSDLVTFNGADTFHGLLDINGSSAYLNGNTSRAGGTQLDASTMTVANNNAIGTGTLTVNGGIMNTPLAATTITLANNLVIGSGKTLTTNVGTFVFSAAQTMANSWAIAVSGGNIQFPGGLGGASTANLTVTGSAPAP